MAIAQFHFASSSFSRSFSIANGGFHIQFSASMTHKMVQNCLVFIYIFIFFIHRGNSHNRTYKHTPYSAEWSIQNENWWRWLNGGLKLIYLLEFQNLTQNQIIEPNTTNDRYRLHHATQQIFMRIVDLCLFFERTTWSTWNAQQ